MVKTWAARCNNYIEPNGPVCDGTLTFEAYDLEAACDKCGARCGKFVADWIGMAPWQRPVDYLFNEWWAAVSLGRDDNYCYTIGLRQLHTGDVWDVTTMRGPWPTKELAEKNAYRDDLESYWEHGLTVYADHCLGCGKYAKVLAFNSEGGWAWRVTECKKCGVLDSRTYEASGG